MELQAAKISLGSRAEPRSRPPWRFSWLELALILGFWTFLAVLTAGSRVLDPFGEDLSSSERLRSFLPVFFNYYMWALLTPLIFWMSSRYSIDRSNWMTRAPMHLAIGFLIAIGVDIYDDAMRFFIIPEGGRMRPSSIVPMRSITHLWFLNELIIFLAVLAAGLARDYFLRYQARQEETVELRAQADRLKAQLSEARLQALRMQINPHFLFNTLHAVSSLVERDPHGVRRMLARLGDLLRYTLEDGNDPVVPLRQELSFLERYLEIQRIRFQGRLEVETNVSENVGDALVPNLILQPIVENAVKHGASHADGIGRVWIGAEREDGKLVIEIADNGPGLDDGAVPEEQSGFGLKNTRERLEEHYGDAFELTFKSRIDGGLLVELTLPFDTNSDPGIKSTPSILEEDAES